MAKPICRREVIRKFRTLGWDGPFSGGKHAFMTKAERKVRIPNPHGGDIDWSLTKRILHQAGISEEEWEKA